MSVENLARAIESLTITSDNLNTNNQIQQPIISNMSLDFKPEYLSCIPQFDGNPNNLLNFISSSESIINTFYDHNNPNHFLNTFILKSIINKLTGNAKIAVNIQTVSTWSELKDTLTRNFSDQRDEICLIRDLVLLKQGKESPLQFYDKVINLLNLLCSFVKSHEATAEGQIIKQDLYNRLSIKTFLAGLKEPLGSAIRAMRPDNLQTALTYINEKNNVRY